MFGLQNEPPNTLPWSPFPPTLQGSEPSSWIVEGPRAYDPFLVRELSKQPLSPWLQLANDLCSRPPRLWLSIPEKDSCKGLDCLPGTSASPPNDCEKFLRQEPQKAVCRETASPMLHSEGCLQRVCSPISQIRRARLSSSTVAQCHLGRAVGSWREWKVLNLVTDPSHPLTR